MTIFRYLWCPRCKTTAKWLMDTTGLYFEALQQNLWVDVGSGRLPTV